MTRPGWSAGVTLERWQSWWCSQLISSLITVPQLSEIEGGGDSKSEPGFIYPRPPFKIFFNLRESGNQWLGRIYRGQRMENECWRDDNVRSRCSMFRCSPGICKSVTWEGYIEDREWRMNAWGMTMFTQGAQCSLQKLHVCRSQCLYEAHSLRIEYFANNGFIFLRRLLNDSGSKKRSE